ncbi:M23 family metallopeptidase [Virgibacillus halophilus]|uniref:M23 family metallopeptidase n=1 Tax=Tigheibacillus halophilus TaxID=361280 RepID=A0ABU5CDH8_9BACI|nr:M23 family metallopeptidase [Virgibacillus halophilus]
MKGILSVALFMGTAIVWQSERVAEQFGPVKRWTSTAMTKEFPFAKVNQVYQETFGSPFSFRTQKVDKAEGAPASSIPVIGNISETFEENGHGIMIAPTGSAKVNSLEEGIVIFAGKDKDTQRTVIVQHADNSQSTYGYLSGINVHLYQYVQKDEQLGEFEAGQKAKNVYFSIQKNNQFIDPMPVIKVNDNH